MENREELKPEPKPAPPKPETAVQKGHPPASAPAAAETEPEEPEGPLTLKQWVIANSVTLMIVTGVIALIVYYFRLQEIIAIGWAALGLSFVVFVHEMGHFLVAKWCNVHVTTFSIGFGPAIPGCSFQWGETTYKLALIPIGGYVQMVGQVDGDESSDGNEDYPRSYRNKSVGQRMAIISAGVIMNVILAMVCFVVVYRGPGKERPVGMINRVDTLAPAFAQGLRTGSRIVEVGDIHNPTFEDLKVTVTSSVHGEKIKLVTLLPGQEKREIYIEPRQDKVPVIGIDQAKSAQLLPKIYAPDQDAPVWPETSAALAGGFQFSDRIIATTDPDNPAGPLKDLPVDPFYPDRFDYFEFSRRMKLLAAERVVIRVARDQPHKESPVTADIPVDPQYGLSLGVRMQMGPITAIRLDSPAAKELVIAAPSSGREGDLILAVQVTDDNGKPLIFDEKNLDPERLPYYLKQWARRLADAEKKGKKVDRTVKLTVRRHRTEGGAQFENLTFDLPWDDSWRFQDAAPLSKAAPLAIPELGLAYQVKAVVAGLQPGAAGNSPLKANDVIRNYRYTAIDPNGKEDTRRWLSKDLDEGDWARITNEVLRNPSKITKLEFKVERGKDNVVEVAVTPTADKTWPLDDRGWMLLPSQERQRADTVVDAIKMGLRDTHRYMMQVFLTLRGIIAGRISPDIIGGPVLIARLAYIIALMTDFGEFVFFLGLISVNLAVVNFMPMPVLDGGHMVFLCYEKLRGRPASETVRVVATYAGLAMILCMFLFVMYNDFMRFVWPLLFG